MSWTRAMRKSLMLLMFTFFRTSELRRSVMRWGDEQCWSELGLKTNL